MNDLVKNLFALALPLGPNWSVAAAGRYLIEVIEVYLISYAVINIYGTVDSFAFLTFENNRAFSFCTIMY